jgi:arylsulfatase A-like enzyme
MRPTNIVFILCDDLGWGDPGCYGQKTLETPNIDRLAAEGIRFTDFYTTSPVCSPARASIMTGLHSGHLPIRQLRDPFLPDEMNTIAKVFHKAGYVSSCVGKYGVGNGQHHDDALNKGFDEHYGYNCMRHAHNYFPPWLLENGTKFFTRNRPHEGDVHQWNTGVGVAAEKVDYSPDMVERRALRFMEEHQNRPFFLFYCPNLPHANNEGGATPDGMEVDDYGEFAEREWSANEKGFARMVQRIDETVGRVVDKLDELGLAEDTIVLFSSDNGPHKEGGHQVTAFDSAGPFQGYKRSLHEGGIRVPFIARCPRRIPAGRVTDLHAYFPDLMNTFCEFTGLEPEGPADGLSLAPVLTGDEARQNRHPFLYFEFMGQLAVREANYKYFRDRDGNESLYDLDRDTHEDHDIKAELPDVFARLKARAYAEHRDYSPTPVPNGALRGAPQGLI